MTTSTQSLFAMAKRYHPALQGDTSLPLSDALLLGQDNTQGIRTLYQHWQRQSPEAGNRYWAARCWSLLIWQPIYLSIVAVHGCQIKIPLEQIVQHLKQGVVAGYTLTPDQLQHAPEQLCLSIAANQLKQMHQTFFNQCQSIFNLRPNFASRLAADIVLSGLIQLTTIEPSITNKQIQELAIQWLAELGWSNESHLMLIFLNDDTPHLALNRKSCCFNYCRADGELCSTCPKLSLDERKRRIAQELSTHA
ncbi:siderophore ferric iron reductase [Celerinatantimonas diazotrophica]|uniref:Siderophore ferric iron reductase n=1 Tax=Celerinatantimonas diazotrophica TaxID=412034 RepID=A0A4R1J848_9GAMM|nr:siderophore ferric iron reductase [Celerinatantimonas diazotrophica]TCK46676.1 siderophore ferric iron reductase [Celerinatantimonas diazotrophica]CAG9295378.1 hypothetical protein CEDIAZO_00494 [Celerinatantimonas diazotrophica]